MCSSSFTESNDLPTSYLTTFSRPPSFVNGTTPPGVVRSALRRGIYGYAVNGLDNFCPFAHNREAGDCMWAEEPLPAHDVEGAGQALFGRREGHGAVPHVT